MPPILPGRPARGPARSSPWGGTDGYLPLNFGGTLKPGETRGVADANSIVIVGGGQLTF